MKKIHSTLLCSVFPEIKILSLMLNISKLHLNGSVIPESKDFGDIDFTLNF